MKVDNHKKSCDRYLSTSDIFQFISINIKFYGQWSIKIINMLQMYILHKQTDPVFTQIGGKVQTADLV